MAILGHGQSDVLDSSCEQPKRFLEALEARQRGGYGAIPNSFRLDLTLFLS